MKNISKTLTVLVIFIGLVIIADSCKKQTESTIAALTTANISGITQTGAISGGDIIDDGGASVTARGICWGIATNPTITGTHTADGAGKGTFTSTITGLTAGTVYYVRAYATNSIGTAYGNEVSFTTTTGSLATLTTTAVSSITATTSVSGGDITDDNGSDITARGVCWSTASNPTIANSHTTDGTGTGSFSSNISGLTAGTMYYARAYATNSVGTAYGNEVSFTTTSLILATLTTTAVSAITTTTATSGGNITEDNGSDITARGVCWSTSPGPTIAGSHTTDGTGTGSFVSTIPGLTSGTVYYVRAYATNGAGTAYGNELSFTTTSVTLATLTTTAVSAITTITATSGGNITDDNGSDITARGVCWSTSPGPTIAGSHTTDGTGTGSFVSTIPGLTSGTVYYVRAYATNGAGTAYGNELSFTTTSVTLATLTTTAVSAITTITATSGGNITDDNGSDITARGVCWSTSPGPTIAGSHTTDGTGTGSFVSTIPGLTSGTVYYVRAYATNGAGTAYGIELSFTTTSVTLATLTTTAVSAITTTTATSGGNITDDNGSNITARGVCWSTSMNPIIAGSHTTDGTGDGIFTSSITGLTPGTVYYVRAYATNSAGTAYGNEVTFTSVLGPGTNEVWIQDRAFKPATITVTAGTTITWTNKDGVNHTVTSTTALFDSGTIANNGTYSHTFNTAGTFSYICTIHPDMTGSVIVNAK